MYKPDVAFLPISKMTYTYKDGGVNGFCRYLDRSLLGQSFQYTAGTKDAARWSAMLGAKLIVPYALFAFSRWATPSEIIKFDKRLSSIGLAERLYPLRPLDTLEVSDLEVAQLSQLRRRMLIAWFRIAVRISSVRHKLRFRHVAKLLRYIHPRRAIFQAR